MTEPPADEGREGSVPEPAAAAAGPPASLAEAPRVPEGDALAIAAPQAAVAAGVPALGRPAGQSPATGSVAAPPPAEVPALPGPAPFGVVGDGQLLLRRVVEDGQQSWMRFPAGSPLSAREELLVPPGFHPSVTVGGVNVALQPCTRATLLTDPDGTPRLEVVFGRVVARAGRSDARLGVTAGGMAGTIMAGLAEPVAVQVDLLRPPGADPASEPARTRAAIVATRGGIQWRQAVDGVAALEGMAAEGMLESHSAIEWNGVDPGRVVVRPSQPPEWADGPPRIEKLERGACEALVAKVVATAPLGKALRELADDRRVENRMIAAETLALLGEFDDLVELLCEAAPEKRLKSQQWSALEAATVPLALARGANAAAKLGRAFDDHGPTGKAGLLQAMSRGFSDEQLAEGADARLVEALDDADLVVRRYAIKCLVDITQPAASDRIRYRPDALPDPRRDGVTWWQGQLKKGLIRRPSSPPAAGAATRPASG
ncbi:MAG: hypothetical protein EBZ59_06830 [Planctomycetia bacterium]|nr:hypothetical protein [Planctomycetia bacterium]